MLDTVSWREAGDETVMAPPRESWLYRIGRALESGVATVALALVFLSTLSWSGPLNSVALVLVILAGIGGCVLTLRSDRSVAQKTVRLALNIGLPLAIIVLGLIGMSTEQD